MNSLLYDIKDILNEKKKIQEGLKDYQIQDIKMYYDLEQSLHIAVKVYVRDEERVRFLILGIDDLEDLRAEMTDNVEEQQKWFDEL
jgi:hypothetical protein